MHINNLGQSCDGQFCVDCGRCDSCSKKLTGFPTAAHTPHRYVVVADVLPPKKASKRRSKGSATLPA